LRALVTTAEQQDDRSSAPHEIDTVPWANMDTQFGDAFADRLDITEIATRQPHQALGDNGPICPGA
jgi:hypothetical protein